MHRSGETTNSRIALWRLTGHVGLPIALLLASLTSVGCIDSDVMIESRRVIAVRTRLKEVDLGKFRVTLPHAVELTDSAELHFHVFGQVTNRDLNNVEEALKKKGPEIRHRMLIVARLMTIEDLEDPKLTSLRGSIAKVVNESLEGEPVQSVGFYRFGYRQF